MKILAIEFSSELRSVAVSRGANVCGYAEERQSRETPAFALMEAALRQAQLGREEIECVAVGIGPGSYAGIRMAIAVAQGWQLARPVRLLGVSSADNIACLAQRAGRRGIVNIVFDAQRNESFAAQYNLDATPPAVVEALTLLTPDEAQRRRDRGELFLKADRSPWQLDNVPVLLPNARMAAELAAARTDDVSGPQLEPVYLRKAEFVKAVPPRWPA